MKQEYMIEYQESIPVNLKSHFNSAVELANWAVKARGLTPELENRGIVLKETYPTLDT